EGHVEDRGRRSAQPDRDARAAEHGADHVCGREARTAEPAQGRRPGPGHVPRGHRRRGEQAVATGDMTFVGASGSSTSHLAVAAGARPSRRPGWDEAGGAGWLIVNLREVSYASPARARSAGST